MRIVTCVKEVPDPNAISNYALSGKLRIASDGRTLEAAAVPRCINGFDEQALEAALRLRDAGVECRIVAVSVALDPKPMLRHCAALGADELVAIAAPAALDAYVTARMLAAWIGRSGGADLVLCGRQASDDDQGVVPVLLAEQLGAPAILFARAIELHQGRLRVTRATPDGDEVVEGPLPAVVTVSNELGTPRFPTVKVMIKARKIIPSEVAIDSLGLTDTELQPRVELLRQTVPSVQGHCEFLSGQPADVARQLIERLRAERIL